MRKEQFWPLKRVLKERGEKEEEEEWHEPFLFLEQQCVLLRANEKQCKSSEEQPAKLDGSSQSVTNGLPQQVVLINRYFLSLIHLTSLSLQHFPPPSQSSYAYGLCFPSSCCRKPMAFSPLPGALSHSAPPQHTPKARHSLKGAN